MVMANSPASPEIMQRIAAKRREVEAFLAAARPRKRRLLNMTIVGGTRDLSADGEPTTQSVAPLDALAEEHGDVSIHAERVDGDLFAVDVFPL